VSECHSALIKPGRREEVDASAESALRFSQTKYAAYKPYFVIYPYHFFVGRLVQSFSRYLHREQTHKWALTIVHLRHLLCCYDCLVEPS